MKKVVLVAGLVLPVLGYAGYLVTLALPAAERSEEFTARLNSLAVHAEAGAKLLRERGPTAVAFHDACKSVAMPVDRLQVVAYFGEPDAKALTPLADQAHYFPTRNLFALNQKDEVKHLVLPVKARGAGKFFEDLLTSPPGEHGWRRNRWNEPFNHPLSEVRYLLVHQLEAATPPRVLDATSYAPGAATFHSGLFNASTGERLCDGQTVMSQDGKVEVRGRGQTQEDAQKDLERGRGWAVLASFVFLTHDFSLGSACALGGPALCEATGFPASAW